ADSRADGSDQANLGVCLHPAGASAEGHEGSLTQMPPLRSCCPPSSLGAPTGDMIYGQSCWVTSRSASPTHNASPPAPLRPCEQ
ncbi:hypothetical protein KUCAC02_033383, partial [Chaenocephalus aceratus]